MGENVYENGGVVVRRTAAGKASGFKAPTRAYAISTDPRAETSDYVVLSSQEAMRVAFAILAGEVEISGRAYLYGIAKKLGFDLQFPGDGPKG